MERKYMDPFVKEQHQVWGDGPEWGEAVGRLQQYDTDVQDLVAKAYEENNPNEILITAMLFIAPHSERTNPVFIRVLERVKRIKEPLLKRLAAAIEYGAPAHVLAKAACNAVLRGIV